MFLTEFKPMASLEDLDGGLDGGEGSPPEDPELAGFVEEGEGTGEGEGAGEGTGEGEVEPGEVEGESGSGEIELPEGEDLPEDNVVVDDIDEEVQGVEALSMELDHLTNLAGAIEQFGISPGMMMVADRAGLLSSTFPVIPATESMGGAYRPESQTSTAALEGVMDAIKSKTAEWAAKAGSAAKSIASKAGGMIKRAAAKAVDLAKWAGAKVWDATKAAGRTVKAHPYKTVAAVIAAIAAVVSVIGLCWAFPTTAGAIGAWFSRIRSAVAGIKFPGGGVKVAATASADAIPQLTWTSGGALVSAGGVATHLEATGAPVRLGALGWTKNAVVSAAKALGSALMKVLSGIGRISHEIHAPARAASAAAGHVGLKAGAAAAKALGGGERAQGVAAGVVGFAAWYKMYRFSMKLTWMLIRKVILGGYNLVKSTISKVLGAATGRGGAAEGGEAEGEGAPA